MKAWIACALGAAGLLVGFVVDEDRALFAYLAAFAFVASVSVGALTLAMIGRLTEARWYSESARRPMEEIVGAIPLLALLFLPIALSVERLYPWAHGAGEQSAFLNVPFFLVRSAVYLVAWSVLATLLPRSPRKTSAVGLIVLGFTTVFAAFDWIMSLEPEWYSTIFGVYFWSGGFLAALAVAVLLGRPHEALGKLLLTASIFWVYTAYSQALVQWIGSEPRDLAWYLVRTRGPLAYVTGVTLAAKFVIPFFVLLPYGWKRRPRVQIAVSALVLFGHALDVGWLVIPDAGATRASTYLVFTAAVVALSGFVLGAATSRRELELA
jgi:hypothetical protein